VTFGFGSELDANLYELRKRGFPVAVRLGA
jgi:hypothetical protein